jgi:hypothetical protein
LIKSDLQKTWGKLSTEDLEKTKGVMKAVEELIHVKYKMEKEDKVQDSKKLHHIYEKHNSQKK